MEEQSLVGKDRLEALDLIVRPTKR